MTSLSPGELEALLVKEDTNRIDERGGVSNIAKLVGSNSVNGLEAKNVKKQRERFGANFLPYKDIPSLFSMLKEALNDETLKILILCAVFSLILEVAFAAPEERNTSWIDGAAILMAVCIVSLIQAFSNHDQAVQFAKINRCNYIYRVSVIRDGSLTEIESSDVVVGDVVVLHAGDKVPADGIIISAEDLEIDVSSATGESDSVMRSVENPFMVSGTIVNQGRGAFLALAVGTHSNFGRIFATLNEEKVPTPLQDKLEDLANSIGYAGMVVATITFISLVISWIYARFTTGWTWASTKDLLSYFVGALTIVVVAVPEGLPLAVTISLAYSMKKMMKDNNFVRHLRACETMGGATVICTDKTGTLTLNEMNVERMIIGDYDFDFNEEKVKTLNQKLIDTLVESICINTTAEINKNGNFGSQTECAIIRMIMKLGVDVKAIRESVDRVHQYQFNTKRKTMSTVYKKGTQYVITSKGAPETIIGQCTKILDKTNCSQEFDSDKVAMINKIISNNCLLGYRMLAIAYRNSDEIPTSVEQAESDLTLIAILAIRDSLRPSTPNAIKKCQEAGIRVIMITGDNALTATTIARDCGIITQDRNVITGDDIHGKSEAEIEDIVMNCCVVARSSPLDKYEVVKALQRRGEIVAVTGDGTNDAPALRTADVGLSMGMCGTELAKEASDIVVLDDNFKSIVSSVIWGRCIFNNVRRFLQFQLTANVVTLFISFISSVVLHDTPFKAVQLLWINLIMDSLGALALATSLPHTSLLSRPPNDRESPLISDFMIQNIGSQSLFQIILMVSLLIFHDGIEARSVHHYTLIFNVFVFCQVFNLINARVVEPGDKIADGFFANPLYLMIMVIISVVEYILVQKCGRFFSSEALSLNEWIFSILMGSLCVPYGIIMRSGKIGIFGSIVNIVTRSKDILSKKEKLE